MRLLLGFGILALWQWNMAITGRYYLDRNLLTARRFATIVSLDLGISAFCLFFPIAFEEVEIPTIWVVLGLGITLLQFVVSYLVARYFYKFFAGHMNDEVPSNKLSHH